MREEFAARSVLRLAAGTPGWRPPARRAEPGLDGPIGGAFLPPPPSLPELDRWIGEVCPTVLLLRRRGWRLTERGSVPAFTRLEVARQALRRALGPLGEDADLLDHAEALLAARLPAALRDAAVAAVLVRAGRLHLRLPLGRAATAVAKAAGLSPALVLSLPAEAAAGFVEADARGIELDLTEPARLPPIGFAALPRLLVRLRWSPALALPPELDPARVVLAAADGAEAIAWARRHQITLVEADTPPA